MFNKQQWSFAAAAFLYWNELSVAQAFVLSRRSTTTRRSSSGEVRLRIQEVVRQAKPQRISDNAEGVLYVNDKVCCYLDLIVVH
jgi:hypothetical protein